MYHWEQYITTMSSVEHAHIISTVMGIISANKDLMRAQLEKSFMGKINLLHQVNELFKTVSEADVHIICNEILCLPEDAESLPEDLISCRLYFEGAMQIVESGNNVTMNVRTFFNEHVYGRIQRLWELLEKPLQRSNDCQTRTIVGHLSQRAGAHLMIMHPPGATKSHPSIVHVTYPQIVQRLEELFVYLLTHPANERRIQKDHMRRVSPSELLVKEFMNQREAANVPELCLHAVEEQLKIFLGEERRNLPDYELSFEAMIKDKMQSAYVNNDGDVVMSMDEKCFLRNSLLVTYLQFRKMTIEFNPKDKPAVPLDVLSGVSNNGTCPSEEGVFVDYYIEKHPFSDRYIVVATLHNHISSEYLLRVASKIGEMEFQQQNGKPDAYLRISSSVTHPKLAHPLVTFGNNEEHLTLYEATPSVSDLERDTLAMTNYLYRKGEEVLEVILRAIITPMLLSMNRLGCPVNLLSDEVACEGSVPRHHPFIFGSGDQAMDAPDSMVVNLTKNRPYSEHSDTRPLKPCNHDNDIIGRHEDDMQIATTCYAFAINSEDMVPDILLRLNHGMPSAKNDDHDKCCLIIGHFSSRRNRFIHGCESQLKSIPLGGDAHTHIQMSGSQGKTVHKMTPVKNTDALRMVMSPRKLKPHLLTRERRKGKFGDKCPKIVSNRAHNINNTVNLLMGRERKIPSHALRTRDSAKNLSNALHDGNSDEEGEPLPGQAVIEPTTNTKPPHSEFKSRKQKCLEVGNHMRGPLREEECIVRDAVIGIPNSYSVENLARSIDVARVLYKHRCSIELAIDNGTLTNIGPLVVTYDNSDNKFLLKPGEVVDPSYVDQSANIHTNKHMKRVANKMLGDTIHLRRLTKNHSSLLLNILKMQEGVGPLEQMMIRGSGAALQNAGQYPISSANENAHRHAPTHYVSTCQSIDDEIVQVMMKSCQYRRAINLFYNGMYLGTWFVQEVAMKTLPQDEVKKELCAYSSLLPKLNNFDSIQFPATDINKQMENELSSMSGVGFWFVLKPLCPDILTLWEGSSKVSWELKSCTKESFVLPSIRVSKEHVKDVFGIDKKFVNVPSLISNGSELCFLTENARMQLFPNYDVDEKYESDDFEHYFSMVQSGAKEVINSYHVVGAAIHAAAATATKACGKCLSASPFMTPPREMLENFVGHTYECMLERTNLKPIMVKPVHPPHLSQEPTAHIAAYVTDSFNLVLRDLDKNGKWKYRYGSDYLINNNSREEAEDILTKCITCSVTSPSALLQYFDDENMTRTFPTNGLFTAKFIKFVNEYEWSKSRMVHPNFSKVWTTKAQFVKFLEVTRSHAGDIFRSAVENNSQERQHVEVIVWKKLNEICDGILTQFHVQVIMRTIEMCIHEPFGQPRFVQGGWGSKDSYQCLKGSWDGEGRIAENVGEHDLPGKIVAHFNFRAKNALIGKSENVTKAQIEDELLVLGLEWSDQLGCLIHRVGIGKRFDACDGEHLLCQVCTMLQNTLPQRNLGLEGHIDKPKYFPIRVSSEKLAKDLPLMQPLVDLFQHQLPAYRRLLMDNEYEHRQLPDVYRIDLDKRKRKEPG